MDEEVWRVEEEDEKEEVEVEVEEWWWWGGCAGEGFEDGGNGMRSALDGVA